MKQVTFNGKNSDEIASLTGKKLVVRTEVRNCSKEHPEGFDYPCAEIETEKGLLRVSLWQTLTIDGDTLTVN